MPPASENRYGSCSSQVLLDEVEKRGGKDGLQAFLDATDAEMGRTALHYAVRSGSEETVKVSWWACVQRM